MTSSGKQDYGKTPRPVDKTDIFTLRQRLLAWYDEHRRSLPWRALPDQTPDPYHVWLSEIMLQQTVVKTVIPYFLKFIKRWPDVHALAAADREEIMKEWAGLGYYARARNLHKCAQIVARDYDGCFPQEIKKLKKLPGIGDYTSAAVRAIAFDKPAVVVDGNVERVLARYFNIEEPLPGAKKILKKKAAKLSEDRTDRPGDFAQAMMDLGATVCIPKNPRCGLCPLHASCAARVAGTAADLPKKAPKKTKPFKKGHVYILKSADEILLERRENNTLLGGMLGFPVSDWVRKSKTMPAHPDWIRRLIADFQSVLLSEKIYHSFTHFDLRLDCTAVFIDKDRFCPENMPESQDLQWFSLNSNDLGLPSLFEKVRQIIPPSEHFQGGSVG